MFHAAVRKREGEESVQNIAIIGAGCSVATLPVAEICHYYNLPMVSGLLGAWVDRWLGGWMVQLVGGWMGVWMGGWVDGWMGG